MQKSIKGILDGYISDEEVYMYQNSIFAVYDNYTNVP